MDLIAIVDAGLGAARASAPALGRRVASAEWLVAYLATGAADSVTLLSYPGFDPLAAAREELARYGVGHTRPRLDSVPAAELAHRLRTAKDPVMFVPDPQIHLLRRAIRLLCPDRPIPAVGLTHTLTTHAVLQDLEVCAVEDLEPFDALVCTSRAARSVVHATMAGTATRLGRPTSQVQLPVIPLGVFTERLIPSAGSTNPYSQQRPLVVTMGRLSIANKMDLVPLLERWREVQRRSGRRPLLVLAGAGDDPASLTVYRDVVAALGLQDEVLIAPDLSDPERTQLLGAAEVFCSPSDNLQETFGLSVVEALAAGKPVVVSDWDGYRDHLEDGVEGFLVPTRWGGTTRVESALAGLVPEGYRGVLLSQQVSVDLDVLVDRLVQLLVDPDLRERMGARAQARAEQMSWPRVIEAFDQVFQSSIQRASASSAGGPRTPPTLAERFASFPSRQVGPQTRLRVTRAGAEVLTGARPPLTYLVLPWVPVVRRLGFTDSPEGRSVEDTLRPLGDDPAALDQGLSALLWMLKRGWLQEVGG